LAQDVKAKVLKVWARERGLMENGEEPAAIRPDYFESEDDLKHQRDQSQLFLLLYIEKLVSRPDSTSAWAPN
jgi:hypothetical protein